MNKALILLIVALVGTVSSRPQFHNRPGLNHGGQPGRPFGQPGRPIGQQIGLGNLGGQAGSLLNGGNFGSATAGGAGNGAVQNGAAIGQGTGVAQTGPGGFGIGLGVGGAVATPLGNLAFGQGESLAVGK